MIRNVGRLRCLLFAMLLGLVPLATCQASLGPPGAFSASAQTLTDALQIFIEDFARQVLQAALL